MDRAEVAREILRLARMLVADQILNADTIEADAEKIEAGIKAPYVYAKHSALGGRERSSIVIVVSTDDKSQWPNGILENSRHIKLILNHDGELGSATQYKFDKKFRKTRVKSVDDAIAKINTFIALV
jgi:hypothetical protein